MTHAVIIATDKKIGTMWNPQVGAYRRGPPTSHIGRDRSANCCSWYGAAAIVLFSDQFRVLFLTT